MNIYSTIREEVEDFINNDIKVVEGYSFNQYNAIKKNHLYYNSQFVNDTLFHGKKKLFRNVVKSPCLLATKFLNFDTKDIRLYPLNPESSLSTFLLEKELKYWLKKNKIANILNQIAEELPIYGSIVLKKTKGGAQLCDLRRLYIDPSVERVLDSRFITNEYYFTPSQLRKKEKDGWKNIEEAISKFGCNDNAPSYSDDYLTKDIESTPYIRVFERFGEVPESELNGTDPKDGERMVPAIFICVGVMDPSRDENGNVKYENGITLFKSEWKKEYPFKDAHYSKTKGRWLGVGVIEDLWTTQERFNELTNQKRVSMDVSSMHLFQTQDGSIIKNILRDLESGAVLKAGKNGGITPIANEERNLAAFNNEEQIWNNQAQSITYSFDAVRGQTLASSTPATNTVIQDRNATSVFAFKKENLGLFIRDFFNDLVIPQVVKEITPEHMLRFTGTIEEMQKLDTLITDALTRENAINMMLNGQLVTADTLEMLKTEISGELKKRGNERFIEVLDGFYKDTEFEFDILVSNEQEDVQIISQNLFTVFTSLAKNPGMLQDPMIRTVFYKWAEKIGINPTELDLAQGQSQMAQPQTGRAPQEMPPQAEQQMVAPMEARV